MTRPIIHLYQNPIDFLCLHQIKIFVWFCFFINIFILISLWKTKKKCIMKH